MSKSPEPAARDRLLRAAAAIMDESGRRDFSTRAVCQAAGVSAPTLYHHFGSKQGLIDAVIEHGFSQYVDEDAGDPDDPIAAIRSGWDGHVEFGLSHPRFYGLLYGDIEPGRPCAITSPALARLTSLFETVAASGGLEVPPPDAALATYSANVGVTLTLIGQPPEDRDTDLSETTREYILDGVLAKSPELPDPGSDSVGRRRNAAITLDQLVVDGASDLSPGELGLLRELLARLAR